VPIGKHAKLSMGRSRALTAAPTNFHAIEFPAKAGIQVRSEIDGPRGQVYPDANRGRGDSMIGTAVKAEDRGGKIAESIC
jgi:hypothetical protein